MYFNTSSICALAMVVFRFDSMAWKLNTVKFSSVVTVEGPFQIFALRPPVENFAT